MSSLLPPRTPLWDREIKPEAKMWLCSSTPMLHQLRPPSWESLEGHHYLADLPRPRSCSSKTSSTGVPTVPEAFRRARSTCRDHTGPLAWTHRQNSLLDGAAKRQNGAAGAKKKASVLFLTPCSSSFLSPTPAPGHLVGSGVNPILRPVNSSLSLPTLTAGDSGVASQELVGDTSL